MNRHVRRLPLMTILITAASLSTVSLAASTSAVNLVTVSTVVTNGIKTGRMVAVQEVTVGHRVTID